MPETTRRLDEIKERCEKATPGPWTWEDCPPTLYAQRDRFRHGLNLLGRLSPDANGPANLHFIAYAREDVPYLLAALTDAAQRTEQLITDRNHAVERQAVLETQLAEAAQRTQWQPIETAPKDGTAILIAVGHLVGEARFVEDEGSELGWWWANEGPGDYHADKIELRQGQPTHWMPLPAAPTIDPCASPSAASSNAKSAETNT